jgi:hypothetical protein
MQKVTVCELTANFSGILERVTKGEKRRNANKNRAAPCFPGAALFSNRQQLQEPPALPQLPAFLRLELMAKPAP